MADGSKELQAQIKRLRALAEPDGLLGRSAVNVARQVKFDIVRQVAAGEDPDGKKWKLTKQGKQPLQNAGQSVAVTARGTTVTIVISGRHARHHLGAVKGKVVRKVIPSRRMPGLMARSIKTVITRQFSQIMEIT